MRGVMSWIDMKICKGGRIGCRIGLLPCASDFFLFDQFNGCLFLEYWVLRRMSRGLSVSVARRIHNLELSSLHFASWSSDRSFSLALPSIIFLDSCLFLWQLS